MKVCINLHNSNENIAHKSRDFLVSFFFVCAPRSISSFVTEQTSEHYTNARPQKKAETETNFIGNCIVHMIYLSGTSNGLAVIYILKAFTGKSAVIAS